MPDIIFIAEACLFLLHETSDFGAAVNRHHRLLLRFCDSNLTASRQGKKTAHPAQTITQDATSPSIRKAKNIHKCGIGFPYLILRNN
ncbi:MAG TPA: hypothetical protein DEQ51_02325 [Alphaproteobacteria bacterium]|nr:hypothetical protein [Alphaproteobacteria bacterium]